MVDKLGHFRLPALRQLGNNVDLANAGQTNALAEYTLDDLSDACTRPSPSTRFCKRWRLISGSTPLILVICSTSAIPCSAFLPASAS
jgi:hypothetical protein